MPPVLVSPNLTMRPATAADVASRLALGPEPDENLRLYGVQPDGAPFDRADAERWVNALIEHPYAWIIEGRSLLGVIRLDRVNLVDKRASLGIGLLQLEQQGRGIGTEAARRVLAYGFDTLGLHRVSVRVLADNGRAIRCYEKCGFQLEGRERETVFLDGAWRDDLIMGVLAHEFRRHSPRLSSTTICLESR
ncbi:GNAT family N-acetyltransferase [Devosia sp. A16]|uniref:GNAT family N-acetyltransferase n=1 Tax=Devosia sp. A16 TaxID=1736675 RepID=UPI0006D7F992|nr:GNAT family protein [Devosia sp. A16]